MTDLPDDFENPRELLNHVWSRLEAAVTDRNSPLHVAGFSTIALNGHPASRMIILREVDVASRTIRFHTDRRSPKVAELHRDPHAAMLFWDPSCRTQLRLTGTAQISIDDDVTRKLIASSHPGALAVFRNEIAPSTPIESPDAGRLSERPLLENIAVVTFTVRSLDWLWLDDAGHRRCRYTFEDGAFSNQWLVP